MQTMLTNADKERASKLHQEAIVVDAHSDYPIHLLRERRRGNRGVILHNHLPNLRRGGVSVEVVTVGGDFVLGSMDFRHPTTVFEAIDSLHVEIEECPEHLKLIRQAKDLEQVKKGGPVGLLLALEGASCVGHDFSLLRNYYRLGLRSVSLTHNERNFLADGCGEKAGGGLSALGKEFVKELSRRRMLIDTVHINERGFFDVLEQIDVPPIVSHSNVRALCNHFRNLTDEQIKAVGEREGVIGLNFLSLLVDSNLQKATPDRLIDHLDYIADLIGIDHVGLGPDFVDYMMDLLKHYLKQHGLPLDYTKYVDGIQDVTGIPKITEALLARGYSDQEVKKVLGENFIRVYKQVLA